MSRPRIDGDAVIPKASGSHLTTVPSVKHARLGLRLGNTRLILPMSVVPLILVPLDTRAQRQACSRAQRSKKNVPKVILKTSAKAHGWKQDAWPLESHHEWPISFGPNPTQAEGMAAHRCILCTYGTPTKLGGSLPN